MFTKMTKTDPLLGKLQSKAGNDGVAFLQLSGSAHVLALT
jgi:hypothetical protein